MQLRKRCAVLLLALLLCSVSVTVCARETPDTSRKGSVTVKMTYKNKAVSGGTLTLYRVGAVAEEDGNYSFALTGDFTGSRADLTDLSSADTAESLAKYADNKKLSGTSKKIGSNGKASFSGLNPGLYLLVQTKAASGYRKADPFLVSVPMMEEGTYLYDVDASPKVELEKENSPKKPTTPSSPPKPAAPSSPVLPQTGQLNWPVPVLAVSGLLLFSAGWILRFGRKRYGYAK